jgi:hypothetical protein
MLVAAARLSAASHRARLHRAPRSTRSRSRDFDSKGNQADDMPLDEAARSA